MAYGRKWQVLVVLDDGTTALDISNSDADKDIGGMAPLRVTFNIDRPGFQAIWFGDVSIYNLNVDTQQNVLQNASRVIVNAGYENGPCEKIFDGDIFQVLYDRENVVDYSITFHCIDGDTKINNNLISFSMTAFQDQRTFITEMAKRARTTIPLGKTIEFDSKKLPRGKVFFGEPKKYIREIARDNNAQWYMSNGELHISRITDEPTGEAIVLSPDTGLIGTPQQIPYGVAFRCELDPRLKISYPAMLVKLDMSLIRQAKAMPGHGIISLLDQDGIYQVAGVRHVGDTRGQEWITEITGVNKMGKLALQLQTNTSMN